ncbi:pollen-specific leucine-rich repeat extensin-like protein 1 [Austrofundulus limnaeus]|uniref:Pollen-specific leucine-rich repeat extensin-like protein 1 n=1 Tax=Austrofundulus limnaeus TaxID=52670 RepID=A0A2I4BJ89_AUSLI|nr:PREDICTED: pollen-specific leucine-rich repeat extensin-like protein 1 [Austrofundulus limnaeus]
MGNRFSRRRDAPVSSAGTVVTEEKTEAEPATTEEENSEITQTPEAVETEQLKAGESEACSPKHESGSKDMQSLTSAPQKDAESESTVKETPPPVQNEPLLSTIKPPEPEELAKPEPDTEAQLAPNPEPPSHQESDSGPISEPTTAEPLEQYTDLLNQEPLPESFFSSPPLIDWSAPDTVSAPASTPVSELPNISAAEQHEGRAEPVGGSTLEPEKFTETPEFLEEEAAGCTKTPESDVDEENVCEVLQNLELKGNDLLNDLIQGEVKIPEDAPIPDVSASIELM